MKTVREFSPAGPCLTLYEFVSETAPLSRPRRHHARPCLGRHKEPSYATDPSPAWLLVRSMRLGAARARLRSGGAVIRSDARGCDGRVRQELAHRLEFSPPMVFPKADFWEVGLKI
jgi:hypothetical protein